MAQFDLPLDALRTYQPEVDEAPGFDAFWAETLAADPPAELLAETLIDNRQALIDTYDLTFTGFGGAPIRAWLHVPAGESRPLPTVVRYHGYSVSRGMPLAPVFAAAGYAQFDLDNRGQGWHSASVFERTPDPDVAAGEFGPAGPMTKGISSPETYYYRRLITDAVRMLQVAAGHRLVDPSRLFVAGGSQGGYLTLAVAGLAPSVGVSLAGAMPDVAFMCHIRRAVSLTDDAPFSDIARFIRAAPHLEDAVWETLGHFDGVSFARRAECPALFSVALADTICPPSTVFAAHNHYGGPREMVVYPHSGHEGGQDVQVWRQLGWLREGPMKGTGMSELFGEHPDRFADPTHRRFLVDHRRALLDFYQPEVCLPSGGFAWIGNEGHPMPEMGAQLFIGARMMHVFSLAAMEGRPGAREVVEHGLDFYLDGPGRDPEFDGWVPAVGGDQPQNRKELYGTAQLLLAASSATAAGFSRGRALLDAVSAVIDRHFWREEDGICVEGYDRTFTQLDDYRGQNANMHLTEAYLAAYEATGDITYLTRATSIARRIAAQAAGQEEGAWRLPEHFTADWAPDNQYNADDPRHPFRPYGSQPGHWLEWTKLLLQLRGLGVDEPWLLPAAAALFDGAVRDAWSEGFVYTVDWDGSTVVEERFFWEVAEAMGAARYLWLATGDVSYQEWYERFWRFADRHFVDHERGSWHSELDRALVPVTHTWDGKPDLYHVYQSTLYAFLPPDRGFAAWLSTGNSKALA